LIIIYKLSLAGNTNIITFTFFVTIFIDIS
jgi:hypothetical protein